MRDAIDPFICAVELAAAIRRKQVSPVEVADCYLETGSAPAAATTSPAGAVAPDCPVTRPGSSGCLRDPAAAGPRDRRPRADRRPSGIPLAGAGSASAVAGQVPTSWGILAGHGTVDSTFGLSAARLEVVNTLAHVASPWQAATEEV